LALASCAHISQAKAQVTPCTLPRPATAEASEHRAINSDDLLRLRDFGELGVAITSEPFELSSDGKWIALQIRQADSTTNDYCTAIVLAPARRGESPTVIDDGGKIVAAYSTAYGAAEVPKGIPKNILIRWSPDSTHLAYTKNFLDRSEIWRFDLADRSAHRLATSDVDIEELAWELDGSTILYSSRPDRTAARKAIEAEGRDGYNYDSRFRPLYSDRPLISANVPLVHKAIRSADGTEVAPPKESVQLLRPWSTWPEGAVAYAVFASGDSVAWSASSGQIFGEKPTLALRVDGQIVPCSQAKCSNVQGLWWSKDGQTLYFERRAGVADGRTEFYAWMPRRGSPRLLLATADSIFGCKLADSDLLCAEETATKPRTLVAISTRNGARHRIFDPNPDFERFSLGTARRLEWSNDFGISTFGDLVLPPGYQGDRRLPLVIVQYDSKGFLRGGTGDEYPIQALAARGFAVLSFNRPPWFAYTMAPRSEDEFNQFNLRNFADRRSNLSSLERIIHQLDVEKIIDPTKVAITGLSDGAVTATFALSHSTLFSAAILSTCCEGPFALEIAGSALDDYYVQAGYPATNANGAAFWRSGSLANALNPKILPILIQASAAEYRMALGTYRELRHRGWPVDMFVYPDEGHIKIEPGHRLAVYRRNIQWLDFWLNGKEDDYPTDVRQYQVWHNLKENRIIQ